MRKENWKNLLIGVSSFMLLFNSFYTPKVLALDLEVTGNGDGAESVVNVTQSSETTVVQQNSAEINNNVQTTSDTGGNDATGNSGDVNIATGNSLTDLNITNSANSTIATVGCCEGDTNIIVSGNGSESQNNVTTNLANSNSLFVNNNASITNSIEGYSNSGNNTANSNGGNVKIETGKVKVRGEVVNGPVNSFAGKVYSGNGDISIFVGGNAGSSFNNVIFNLDNRNLSDVINYAGILNDIYWYANSGGNEASSNNGAVQILTGDVFVDFLIKNGPINTSVIEVDCCNDELPDDPEDPDDPGDDEDDGDDDEDDDDKAVADGDDNGVGGAEQVASMVTGKILGLSNTSGNSAQTLLFWVGAIILTLGVNFIGKNTLSKKYSK
jgi:hypothetical protein